MPIVFDSFGNMGPRTKQSLAQLADEAGTNQISQKAKPGLLGRWRTDLERIVVHAVADSVLTALGGAVRKIKWLGASARNTM